MRKTAPVRSVSRFATRQVAFALIIVIFAMGALALLAEALNSGGGTVYLAEIQPSAGGPAAGSSLVVAGYGSASMPAEFATIQMMFMNMDNGYGGGFPSSTLDDEATPAAESVEQRVSAPIVEAMITAGAPADAVTLVASETFMSTPYGPPTSIAFRLDVMLLNPDLEVVSSVINAAGQAATEDGYRMVQSGVAYGISECGPLRQAAWENALADARSRAAVQAELLGVETGDLLFSNEALASDAQTVVNASNGHGSCAVIGVPASYDLFGQRSVVSVPPFDPSADPLAIAYASLTLGFEIKD